MILRLLIFIIIQLGFTRKYVNTTKSYRSILNQVVEEPCFLNPDLIREIKSYKNITQQIMEEIKTTSYGYNMYQQYTQFVDRFGPRVSGSDNLERAIDHMINLTHEYGVTDVTTEDVEVPYWVRGAETVTMLTPFRKNIAVLGLAPNVPTPPEGITANVIVVNSFADFKSINPDNINGKIVLFNAPFTSYEDTVKYRLLSAQRAASKGAVASLIRSITPFSLYTPHTGFQLYDVKVPKIPSGAITLEDADLIKRLHDEGSTLTLNIYMDSTLEEKMSRNTIIDLKGRTNPDNFVMVSGHIDSWDVGQGALDSGSMMISWNVPIILNRMGYTPKRTVRAALWTAEEFGSIGAKAYLKNHRDEMDKINLLMESDQGTFKPSGLDMAGSREGRCIISEILKLFSPTDKLKNSANVGSDIRVFKDYGIPRVSLLNKNDHYYWYHNSEADTLYVQNRKHFLKCAAFWAAFSYVAADLSVNIPRV